jgi:hypothetical protein
VITPAQARALGIVPKGKPRKAPKAVPMVELSAMIGSGGIIAFLPFRVLTVQSRKQRHHFVKARRNREFSTLAAIALRGMKRPALPVTVTLTSLYRGLPMDPGNLAVAMKGIEDVLADWLIPGLLPGRADGDARLSFIYSQEKSPLAGVRVWIAPTSNHSQGESR